MTQTATKTKAESNGHSTTIETPVQTPVEIPSLELRRVEIKLVGTSPLISHRWSDKAKEMMLAKQTKRASIGRAVKDPHQDYLDSLYPFPSGGYGFPAIAFKSAAVRAGTYSDQKMTFLRGAFHVRGELIKIDGEPSMREDMVRVGNGVADIHYRGQFVDWKTILPVEYNSRAITLEQLANLFMIAGFSVGVGEWRPERNGAYGTFKVV